MPIAYRVDHDARVVVAAGYGTMTDADFFGYQREVWSRPDVKGYDELVDMARVTHVVPPSAGRVRDLVKLSAGMDSGGSCSRFAIVAPANFEFGLGRMFQAYRQLDPRSTKKVGVFRTMAEALVFLGLARVPELPEIP